MTCLLITLVKKLDLDQDGQHVAPDLDPNLLIRIAFLNLLEKLILKISRQLQKQENLPKMQSK